ncbi:MAG: cystine ABC transporter substrate-binding protein [Lautropia sp.]|nr:cystine ABC transporter substrate-binding protein [Lautropia sp.]
MKTYILRRRLLASCLFLTAAVLGTTTPPVRASEDAYSVIQKRGTLNIGIEGTYPPFNYQDENGQFVGFEIDLGNALAQAMGLKASFQPTKWDGLLAALDAGRIDVIINQVTISEARQKKYNFSQPYTVSGIQAVTRRQDAGSLPTPEALSGRKIGVGLGTNYEEWARHTIPGVDIRTYEDDPTKNQDLAVGRLDAVLVDRLAALYQVKHSHNRFALGGPAFSHQESGIPTRKSDKQLLAALNHALDQLRAQGTLTQLSKKWFDTDVTHTR